MLWTFRFSLALNQRAINHQTEMTPHAVPALPYIPAQWAKYILSHVKVTESETSFLTQVSTSLTGNLLTQMLH